jgi:hypothetical protein
MQQMLTHEKDFRGRVGEQAEAIVGGVQVSYETVNVVVGISDSDFRIEIFRHQAPGVTQIFRRKHLSY